MSQPLFLAFVAFAVVMFFTPGPNNIMLLSSGLTYGFRRTLPHVAGIALRFSFMIWGVGGGLGGLFFSSSGAQSIPQFFGAVGPVSFPPRPAMGGTGSGR